MSDNYHASPSRAKASQNSAQSKSPNNKQATALDAVPRLLHYMSGEGGTGKNLVIKTIVKGLKMKGALNRIQFANEKKALRKGVDILVIHGYQQLRDAREKFGEDLGGVPIVIVYDDCCFEPSSGLSLDDDGAGADAAAAVADAGAADLGLPLAQNGDQGVEDAARRWRGRV